jgi:hypothetical protein
VGGISAASSAPIRPLVPAPTLNQRPPPESATISTSAASAMRGSTAPTASQARASSPWIVWTIRSVDHWSMSRVDSRIVFGG